MTVIFVVGERLRAPLDPEEAERGEGLREDAGRSAAVASITTQQEHVTCRECRLPERAISFTPIATWTSRALNS